MTIDLTLDDVDSLCDLLRAQMDELSDSELDLLDELVRMSDAMIEEEEGAQHV